MMNVKYLWEDNEGHIFLFWCVMIWSLSMVIFRYFAFHPKTSKVQAMINKIGKRVWMAHHIHTFTELSLLYFTLGLMLGWYIVTLLHSLIIQLTSVFQTHRECRQ